MDKLDRDLLGDLTNDARISFAELGRKYGLTRASIKERVEKLKQSGVIEKFTVIINPDKCEKKVSAFLEIDVEPGSLNQVAEELASDPLCESLYLMSGSSTLHMHSLLTDMDDLRDLVLEKIYSTKGVLRVQTHVLLKRYKNRTGGLRL